MGASWVQEKFVERAGIQWNWEPLQMQGTAMRGLRTPE
jgi:hypothetical protein